MKSLSQSTQQAFIGLYEAYQGTFHVLGFFLTASDEFSKGVSGEGVEDFEP